ncbi:MAG: hypothetical protein ABI557_13570 [Aureliella sp.]
MNRSPKLVATVLSGNAESIIEAAILSARDWVDEICLIDTGISDATMKLAIAVAGDKLSHSKFDWCNDFAMARNAALVVADRAQATWAMTLDTDERLEFTDFDHKSQLIEALDSSDVTAWTVAERDGSYCKERFVRIPSSLRWQGRTHEALTVREASERKRLVGCRFWETSKSPVDFQRKLERDLIILLNDTVAEPQNARLWYYLAQTYEGMKLWRHAVDAFDRCARMDQWPDESSWACYCAARCLSELQEYRRAEEYCALGITRKPSRPETAWLAGWCCFQRRALEEAVAWSRIAIFQAQQSQDADKIGFHYVPAWFEAPYDVLRFALRELGQLEDAEQAEIEFEIAKAERLSLFSCG